MKWVRHGGGEAIFRSQHSSLYYTSGPPVILGAVGSPRHRRQPSPAEPPGPAQLTHIRPGGSSVGIPDQPPWNAGTLCLSTRH